MQLIYNYKLILKLLEKRYDLQMNLYISLDLYYNKDDHLQ